MAENENGEEKTENATAKKRKDARKQGNVLQSQDINIVCSILLLFFVLRLCAPMIFSLITNFMSEYVGKAGGGIGDMAYVDKESFVRAFFLDALKTVVACTIALFAAAGLVSVISSGIQTRFIFTTESMKFKLSKLNPLKGIKGMFSLKKIFQLFKSIVKLVLLIVIVYNQISSRLPEIVRLMYIDIKAAMVYTAQTIFTIGITIGGVFIAVAAVDFMFQRREFENDLKMTKQEVKDEFKQMEGDPKIKGKRRAIQQKMAMQRMMQEVPSADVIIRNPTHFAVAVKYDPSSHAAPVVIAKGKDMAALRIVDAGAEADVPSVENRELARALYDKVDVGAEIPSEFYQGVADVLWFVYNLKNKPIPQSPKKRSDTDYNY